MPLPYADEGRLDVAAEARAIANGPLQFVEDRRIARGLLRSVRPPASVLTKRPAA
jgi:hypothetical protein